MLSWELGKDDSVPLAWAKSFNAAANNNEYPVFSSLFCPPSPFHLPSAFFFFFYLIVTSILILQHALLGINAHINNDLAQVNAIVCLEEKKKTKGKEDIFFILLNSFILDEYHNRYFIKAQRLATHQQYYPCSLQRDYSWFHLGMLSSLLLLNLKIFKFSHYDSNICL